MNAQKYMKQSKKKNNFPDEVRFLFLDDNYWECAECGQCHANCLHHIFGRGREEGCEKSALNACPLENFRCHLAKHGYLMSAKGRKKMLEWNLNFLSDRGYKLKPIDNEFLEKYGVEYYKLGIKI